MRRHVLVAHQIKRHVQEVCDLGITLCLDLKPVLLHDRLDLLNDPVVLFWRQAAAEEAIVTIEATIDGPKGRNLEVGARRAPRLLVCQYLSCV